MSDPAGTVPSGQSPEIRVAIVGCGIISDNHVAAILRVPGLRITVVVDPLPESTERLAAHIARRTGTAPGRHQTLHKALSHEDADLVVICTPSGTHGATAQEALRAGRHVVIEKPLDATLAAARRLLAPAAEAQARGQVCSVISQHRFDPSSVAVADAIRTGRFGRVTSAVASVAWWRGQDYYDAADWRGTWAYDGGGATMNQGIHTVDLLVWMLGQPVEVYAHAASLAHERIEVEDVMVATVRFASGALGVLHATTAAYPGLAVRLQVHGSRGSAIIHDDQLEYFHAAGDGGGAATGAGDPANQAAEVVAAAELRGAPRPDDAFVVGHLRQYHDIVEAIRHGRAPGVGVPDALLAMAVVKALYLSATLALAIRVEDVLDGLYDDVPVTVSSDVKGSLRP